VKHAVKERNIIKLQLVGVPKTGGASGMVPMYVAHIYRYTYNKRISIQNARTYGTSILL